MLRFERIDADSDVILRNLYEHYVHDMSEWFGMDTQADGRFAYDTAPLWRDAIAVYLARSDEKLAGFAVISSAEKWLGNPSSRDVKDFFVLRAYRGKQISAAMAAYIWNQHPAAWIVRVLTANKPALPFWRRAVRDYTHERAGGAFQEDRVLENGREWVQLRFDNSRKT